MLIPPFSLFSGLSRTMEHWVTTVDRDQLQPGKFLGDSQVLKLSRKCGCIDKTQGVVIFVEMKLVSVFFSQQDLQTFLYTYKSFLFTNGLLGGSSTTVVVDKLVSDSQNPMSLKNAAASSSSVLPKKMTFIYLNVTYNSRYTN